MRVLFRALSSSHTHGCGPVGGGRIIIINYNAVLLHCNCVLLYHIIIIYVIINYNHYIVLFRALSSSHTHSCGPVARSMARYCIYLFHFILLTFFIYYYYGPCRFSSKQAQALLVILVILVILASTSSYAHASPCGCLHPKKKQKKETWNSRSSARTE